MWPVSAEMLACCCLCVLLACVSAQSETVYRKIGDEVVFNPGPVSSTIIDIAWKHNEDLAIDWDGKEITPYRQFEDRGSLNITTGEMKLTRLTRTDSGNYTVDINNIRTKTLFILRVISAVPVPTVSQSCDDDTSTCTLTCDGNTTGAEPVTYVWKPDNINSPVKQLKIKNDSSTTAVEEFSCVLKNKVSNESSTAIPNPFKPEPPEKEGVSSKMMTGIAVFIFLLAPVLLLAFVHRCKAGMWFFEKDSMPWERDFWSNEKKSSSAASQNRTQKEEETPIA